MQTPLMRRKAATSKAATSKAARSAVPEEHSPPAVDIAADIKQLESKSKILAAGLEAKGFYVGAQAEPITQPAPADPLQSAGPSLPGYCVHCGLPFDGPSERFCTGCGTKRSAALPQRPPAAANRQQAAAPKNDHLKTTMKKWGKLFNPAGVTNNWNEMVAQVSQKEPTKHSSSKDYRSAPQNFPTEEQMNADAVPWDADAHQLWFGKQQLDLTDDGSVRLHCVEYVSGPSPAELDTLVLRVRQSNGSICWQGVDVPTDTRDIQVPLRQLFDPIWRRLLLLLKKHAVLRIEIASAHADQFINALLRQSGAGESALQIVDGDGPVWIQLTAVDWFTVTDLSIDGDRRLIKQQLIPIQLAEK